MGGVAGVSEAKTPTNGIWGYVACSKYSGGSHQRPPELYGILVGENVGSNWPTGHELHQPLVEKAPFMLLVKPPAVFLSPQEFSPSHNKELVVQNLLMNSLQNQWVSNCIRLNQGESELESLRASQDGGHPSEAGAGSGH